jgi:inorganic pyrophosphatase
MKPIDVIIETPRGSNLKYAYEPESGFFKIKRALPAGMIFPYDFGFIPNTKGEDGDPLDIIVISEFTSFPGCKMECRLIGTIVAKQSEGKGKQNKIRNDRLLGVPLQSVVFEKTHSINNLPQKMLKELQAFFIQYNQMENKTFTVTGFLPPRQSYKLLTDWVE